MAPQDPLSRFWPGLVAGMSSPNTSTASATANSLWTLGHYRLLRHLGSGGMGLVFLAEDLTLQRRVALKVMRPEVASDYRARRRFLNEARATAALKNDHLITIYQVGEAETPTGKVPYLAMEYLEGESLNERLQREPILHPLEVARIAWEIALGLAAAHEAGVVHRDIKPANLWLEVPSGRVKILDFGLARALDGNSELTGTGHVVGTPAFMAPEQARGEVIDHRVDIFSLGCVLYRCATGIVPFRANDVLGVLSALATSPPTPPHLLNLALPLSLSQFIMQLLEKEPARRPASAPDVLRSLQQLAASTQANTLRIPAFPRLIEPILVEPVSPPVAEPVEPFAAASDDFAFVAKSSPTVPTLASHSENGLGPALLMLMVVLVLGLMGSTWMLSGRGESAKLNGEHSSEIALLNADREDPLPGFSTEVEWLKQTKALTGAAQWDAVSHRLRALNAGYDGGGSTEFRGEILIGLNLAGQSQVRNIRPIQALTRLESLNLSRTAVSDLSPLQGMNIRRLVLNELKITNYQPLKTLPLETLVCPVPDAATATMLKQIRTLKTVNEKPIAQLNSR